MKLFCFMKQLILTITFTLATFVLLAQTITLRPNASNGKDAWVVTNQSNTNYGSTPNYAAISWSSGGTFHSRSLLSFDLSAIPATAIILDAKLSLYSNTTSDHSQLHSGSNSCYLERITSSWNESTVTWNNQPATTTVNRVTLPASTSSTQNYLDINVTNLVTDMVNNPTTSDGFMLKLATEAVFRSLIFASSDHSDSTRRPKLEITYQYNFINLTKPTSSNDTLFQGISYPITYAASGTGNIKIEYSTNLSTWTTIAGSVNPVSGVYNWTPNFTANACWIRVSSIGSPQLSSTTSSPFKILPTPMVSFVNPNAGGNYFVGDTLKIDWTSSGVFSLALDYKIGNGGWTNITSNINPQVTSYNWLIPNINSSQVLLRIRAISPISIFDQSDSILRIAPKPQFNLLTPNGQEVWLNNGPKLITWQSVNSNKVNLYYLVNGGDWITIADNIANTNSYLWQLPVLNSDSIKVKITDSDFNLFLDTSDLFFTIKNPPALSISEPLANQVFFQGDTLFIKWSAIYSNQIKIEYSPNNGLNWNLIENNFNATVGLYKWFIPNNINSKNVKIKISDLDFPLYASVSFGTISILPKPSITLVSPNTYTKWLNNKSQLITWTSNNANFIDLLYSTNKTNWLPIKDSINEILQTYTWDLPNIQFDSVWFMIRCREFPQFFDISKTPISIVHPPNIQLTNPKGNETLYIGNNYSIEWNATNSRAIKIDYSTDNINWNPINDSVPSSNGIVFWQVPNSPTFNGKIRIIDLDFQQFRDSNEISFKIVSKPTLNLVTPNGGENLVAGQKQNIVWSSSNLDKVRILLTLNGIDWIEIDSNIDASAGVYNWDIPNVNSLNCKIKVADMKDETIYDESANSFKISPSTGLIALPNESMNIYPNPISVTSSLIIENTYLKVNEVILMDAFGKRYDINLNDLNGNVSIDFNNEIKPGLYLLLIKSDNRDFIHKIVVKN